MRDDTSQGIDLAFQYGDLRGRLPISRWAVPTVRFGFGEFLSASSELIRIFSSRPGWETCADPSRPLAKLSRGLLAGTVGLARCSALSQQ